MPAKKARIKDIADLAGVSIGTVDRVLHERGEVAERTRKKIKVILKEMNYSPDLIASALKTKKRFHLAALLPEPTNESIFWDKHTQGMDQAMNELSPFPVNLSKVTFNILNEDDFQIRASEVLEFKPDGVLLAPVFKSQSIAFCEKLYKRQIPFAFIDGYIREAPFLAYIGEDAYKSGRVAGQLADMITPLNKDILVVNIAKNIENTHHLNNRTNGFLSYLRDSGGNQGLKINLNILKPDNEEIRKEADKIFGRNTNIGAIFVSSSKTYKIAGYLEEKGLKSVNLIGYDLLDENVRFLKSGFIRFLLSQRPKEQAYKGVKKLFDFLSLNRIPEKMEYLPIDIITSENVNFFR
jgi:LacI family transcriptional regulator